MESEWVGSLQEQSATRRRLNDAHVAVWVVKRVQERRTGREGGVKKSELKYVSFFLNNDISTRVRAGCLDTFTTMT